MQPAEHPASGTGLNVGLLRPNLLRRNLVRAQRWSLLQMDRLATRLHPPPSSPAHLLTGERGEFEAMFFLRAQGYLITERRWRSLDDRGDLDLIAWHGTTLCFIEVKTRTERDFAPATASIDDAKRRILRRMARAFVRTLPPLTRDRLALRFDVVAVYLLASGAEFELTQHAFPVLPADRTSPRSSATGGYESIVS